MAFSGPSSLWGPTSFPCLWKSKPILIFNSFYSNPYTRILMFSKQINESNLLIPKRDKWYLHTTDPKDLKKIKIKPKAHWSQRKDMGWHRGVRIMVSASHCAESWEKKESSLFTHRPVLPLWTWNSLGAWNVSGDYGIVLVWLIFLLIKLFIILFKQRQHQNDLPPFIFKEVWVVGFLGITIKARGHVVAKDPLHL